MKIFFLANAASIHTVRWVNALAERNHEIHLIFNSDDTARENKISDLVFQHRLKYSGTKGYLLNVVQVRHLFREIDPDIVNAHYASGYGSLARLARLNPLVLSVWGSDVYDFPYQGRMKMRILKKNLRYATRIASTSHCMADQVKRLLGTSKVDVGVTPFGVDTVTFSPREKRRSEGKIVIGNIKTLAPEYGIVEFLRAVKVLRHALEKKGLEDISSSIVVSLYGDGPQKDEIVGLVNDLQLSATVKLKGRIPNSQVPEALSEMDIFCVSSVRESFGVAAVEAMAMGLPVVATDAEGLKEVVIDGKTGIIVPRHDQQALANALQQLVLDPRLRDAMGKAGRRRVIESYDWNKNVGVMESIYNNAIHATTQSGY